MIFTRLYLKINGIFQVLEKWIAVVLISSIVIIVFASTFSRYVLNEPLFGADRLATYIMVSLGFLGFQIATGKMRHIEIEFIKSRVPLKVKAIMNMLVCLLACVFLLRFSWFGYELVLQSKELEDKDLVLDISLWKILAFIPFTFLISALRYFLTIFLWLEVFQGKRKEEEFVTKQLI